MIPGFLVRLRPTGPWRLGPDSGARDRVDRICHSDSVYSAVSSAMLRLGRLDEWLAATAGQDSQARVRFSSLFPFQDRTLFVVPPRSLWPPFASAKVRWKGARFVPTTVVAALLAEEQLNEERWDVDAPSECLLPQGSRAPFRVALRAAAAVDRVAPGSVDVHTTACLEFNQGAGLWAVAAFADEEAAAHWSDPVKGAFRLLADSGFGGERSRGWGRSESPEFTNGVLPDLVCAPVASNGHAEPSQPAETSYWLLSLFSPASGDAIDWRRGAYALLTRSGRIESPARWGAEKRPLRMVEEGSVLLAPSEPRGTARDVAPAGFPHPVYRAGFGLSIAIPWRLTAGQMVAPPRPKEVPAPPPVESTPPEEPIEPESIVAAEPDTPVAEEAAPEPEADAPETGSTEPAVELREPEEPEATVEP